MSFDFKVNNSLYLYKTSLGDFFVKEMHVASDFYGMANAKNRLELVSGVTAYLRSLGMPLELVNSSASGKFLVPFGRNVLRVFNFFVSEELNPAEPEQFRQMVLLSKKLHESPIEKLVISFPNMTSLLVAPYGLDETLKQFHYLRENLTHDTHAFQALRSNLRVVFDKGLTLCSWNSKIKPVLTHMDFHPRNVLWGENGAALMIDMDYLRVGNPFVCLGLTLTRTLLFLKREISSENFSELANEMHSIYCPQADRKEFTSNLISGAILCEVEKILRNLYRFYRTQEYRGFADDVVTLHYPLFLKLLKVEEDIL
jgi:hypothetical protein